MIVVLKVQKKLVKGIKACKKREQIMRYITKITEDKTCKIWRRA